MNGAWIILDIVGTGQSRLMRANCKRFRQKLTKLSKSKTKYHWCASEKASEVRGLVRSLM
jgi:hypothetical protein